LAFPIFRVLLAMKARQTVSQHVAEHAHKQGTPTMGGLIILAGLIPALTLFVTSGTYGGPAERGRLAGLLVLIAGYALIGFVDDFVIPRLMKGKRGLGWTQKLLLQIGLAVLGLWMLGVTAPIALAIAVFLVLFFSNAYNFTDGLDWLASTVMIALAVGIVGIALMIGASTVAAIFAIVIGSMLPFMVLNRPPARIFMGDVGSMPLGAALGAAFFALALPASVPSLGGWSDSKGNAMPADWYTANPTWPVWLALGVLSFVMIAELVPVPLQILSVKIRKKRLFPMTPIHHAFQKAGWKETKIVALFFAVQLVCTLVALGIASTARGDAEASLAGGAPSAATR